MTDHPLSSDPLIRAVRAAAEAFLASLDESAGVAPVRPTPKDQGPPQLVDYDPLRDEPPFAPNPAPGATSQQQKLAALTYLGAIGRLNAEEDRGARSKEISEFARKAGYSGGAAVNGWNSRKGSPRAVEVVNGERFLNADGLSWILKDAKKLGLRLKGETATVPRPS